MAAHFAILSGAPFALPVSRRSYNGVSIVIVYRVAAPGGKSAHARRKWRKSVVDGLSQQMYIYIYIYIFDMTIIIIVKYIGHGSSMSKKRTSNAFFSESNDIVDHERIDIIIEAQIYRYHETRDTYYRPQSLLTTMNRR